MGRRGLMLLAAMVGLGWMSLAFTSSTYGDGCLYTEGASRYCYSPRVIPGSVGQHVVLMDVSTATDTVAMSCGSNVGHAVYFNVTPEVTGWVTVSTCHPMTGYDTVLDVMSGGSQCEWFTLVGCNDDSGDAYCDSTCSGQASKAAFWGTAGTTYRIRVGSYDQNSAGCPLCLGLILTIGNPCGEAPRNIVCGEAYGLPGSPGVHEMTVDARETPLNTESWFCPYPSSINVNHPVWFKFRPDVSGTATFTTCHPTTNYDTVVKAVSGCSGPLIFTYGCNDDVPGSGTCSQVSFPAVREREVFVEVGSYGATAAGCLGVRLTMEPGCTQDGECNDQNPCTEDRCEYGACSNPALPYGTSCPDDGNQCTYDRCDGSGMCTHPNKPSGTLCGDPSDTACTDPDMCNSSGQCLPNHAPYGTPCPDALFCNGAEICDGTGLCQPGDGPCGLSELCNEDQDRCDPLVVAVPNVVGMTQSEAERTLAGRGLEIGAVGHAYSESVAADHVISQDPGGGVSVVIGTAVDLMVSLGQPGPGSFVHVVDPGLPPSLAGLPVPQGEAPRVVSAVLAPDGTQDNFVVDEVILYAPEPQILNDFIEAYDAEIIQGADLPEPPGTVPPDAIRHEYAQTGYYLLRVRLSRADLSDLPLWMEELGMNGEFVFSSEEGLRLSAILAKSRVVQGLEIFPNLVGYIPSANCVLTQTSEYDDGPPDPPRANAFAFPHLNDSELQVTRAWQYIDLLGLSRPKVNLAIVDSGFAFNQDFPSPDTVPQYDFANKTYSVDGQQNPYACGGSGPGCTYHGVGAYSVAAAIPDNQFGSAGTSGNVTFPYLMRHDHTLKGVMWAVDTAVYWGADVVNANWEGHCGWWCRNFGSDYGYAEDVLSRVANAEVFMTVPAGNEGYDLEDHDLMPCEMWGTTCVGGIDLATKEAVTQSNHGSWVEIYAPFNGLMTTPNPGVNTPYTWFGGTCGASPYVAGIGAMMKYVDPAISLNDLRSILVFNKANIKNDPRLGTIRYVNAFEAVKETAQRAGLSPKGDSFEPNDTEATARAITPGTHTATLALGDQDFYTFETADYTELQLTVTYMERINPVNKLYTRLNGEWGTDVNGTYDFSQTLLPPGKYVLEVWGSSNAMNCYTITLGLPVSVILPDLYDDLKPAGEPRNDGFNQSAVIPDVVEPFGLLSSVGIYDLNHDILGDTDFFKVQIDEAEGPYGEPECCETVDEYTSQGRFEIMVSPDPYVVRPFEIRVYRSDGSLFETKTGLNYSLQCPHAHFPDGKIAFSVQDKTGRNFYDLSLLYNRCDRRILPHWTLEYEVPPFFRLIPEFIGHTPWIFPGDPGLLDRILAGEPPGDIPPEYLIFDREISGPYILDVGFPRGGDLNVNLFNEAGQRIATAEWMPGLAVKRLEVGSLIPGTYYIRMEGTGFATPCVLSSMAADPEAMAGEFGRADCQGYCAADYDHDDDVDGMDLGRLARMPSGF